MMEDKPFSASGYEPEWAENVRAGCLYLATVLGDLLKENLVIIGGLVPGLLIDQTDLAPGVPPHAGTKDLDLGLKLGVFEEAKYSEIARRLREAGFQTDTNEKGNPTLQRWRIVGDLGKLALVEFLIEPTSAEDRPGEIKHLEKDFGAMITPGIQLAFRDREPIRMSGQTIMGEQVTRELMVCGPGAFVILKALAFAGRGKGKDAYDLYYVIRNFRSGPGDVAQRLKPLLDVPEAQRALKVLLQDFRAQNSPGPVRAASFNDEGDDEVTRQEVVGFVDALLKECL